MFAAQGPTGACRFNSEQRRLHGLGCETSARKAERLGASRAMDDRLLQDLAKDGYIEVSRERIVLLSELPRRW